MRVLVHEWGKPVCKEGRNGASNQIVYRTFFHTFEPIQPRLVDSVVFLFLVAWYS
jgi:hypothetical protein